MVNKKSVKRAIVSDVSDIVLPSANRVPVKKSGKPDPAVVKASIFEKEVRDYVNDFKHDFVLGSVNSSSPAIRIPDVLFQVIQQYDGFDNLDKLLLCFFDKTLNRVFSIAYGSVYDYIKNCYAHELSFADYSPSDYLIPSNASSIANSLYQFLLAITGDFSYLPLRHFSMEKNFSYEVSLGNGLPTYSVLFRKYKHLQDSVHVLKSSFSDFKASHDKQIADLQHRLDYFKSDAQSLRITALKSDLEASYKVSSDLQKDIDNYKSDVRFAFDRFGKPDWVKEFYLYREELFKLRYENNALKLQVSHLKRGSLFTRIFRWLKHD